MKFSFQFQFIRFNNIITYCYNACICVLTIMSNMIPPSLNYQVLFFLIIIIVNKNLYSIEAFCFILFIEMQVIRQRTITIHTYIYTLFLRYYFYFIRHGNINIFIYYIKYNEKFYLWYLILYNVVLTMVHHVVNWFHCDIFFYSWSSQTTRL